MLYAPWFLLSGLLATFPSQGAVSQNMDTSLVIQRGDVLRDAPPNAQQAWVPLYQGNGRFGACYGPWGLQADRRGEVPYMLDGKTQFTHMQYYARLKYNMDYLLPLATIHWVREPARVTGYSQHQSFYDGTVTTSFEAEDYSVTVVSWFDPVHRNLAGFQIDAHGDCPPIVVAPCRRLLVHYDQRVRASFEGLLERDTWTATLRAQSAHATLTVRSNTRMSATPYGVQLDLIEGRNDILVSVNEPPAVGAEESRRATQAWWHDTWNNSGWLDLPDDTAQKVWVRSLAYVLSSYNDDNLGCAPPNGLSGNQWPMPFPEDLSFIHPLLLSTGHVEIARAWIEFWQARLAGFKEYTRRRFNRYGAFIPWNIPYGSMEGYHDPEPPNNFSNALHNGGYMARMAHETAVMLNNPRWTETYADPLIHEIAIFFLSIIGKEKDGLWHLYVEPSIGQDEYGGINQRDYLCALFSAKYSLQKAIEHGFDENGRMAAVLRDGLAFPALLSDRGFYYTSLGSGSAEFGQQKHPVQLNPLAFLPLSSEPDPPTEKAYELRYEITRDASKPLFYGWSLGEFILASARMRDIDGWLRDWDNVLPAHYTDPDWTQFYESSDRSDISFYVTTHGLFAQSLLDTVVSTWWNRLDLAPCTPWSGPIRFGNIYTPFGVTVSGEIADGKGQVRLTASRDTAFECERKTLVLRKGQQTTIRLAPDSLF